MFQVLKNKLSFNNFLEEINNLKLVVKKEEANLVRFFFTKEKIFSITIPSSKLEFNLKEKIFLPAILPFISEKSFLLPSSHSAFMDPCAVQSTLCVLSSEFNFIEEELFLDEKRVEEELFELSSDELRNPFKESQQIKSTVKIQFTIDSDDDSDFFTDIYHDLRSDMVLEMLKSGIEILQHSSANGKNTITFHCEDFAKLPDLIQKSKIIIFNIANSYGKKVNFFNPINNDIATITIEIFDNNFQQNEINGIQLLNKSHSSVIKITSNVNPYFLII